MRAVQSLANRFGQWTIALPAGDHDGARGVGRRQSVGHDQVETRGGGKGSGLFGENGDPVGAAVLAARADAAENEGRNGEVERADAVVGEDGHLVRSWHGPILSNSGLRATVGSTAGAADSTA
ncbi:hypothetical protein GCM10010198_00570 [Nocardia seriolae]